MSTQSAFSRAALCSCALLPVLLVGCSDDGTVTVNPAATPLATGNWQVSSSASAAAKLSSLSGALSSQSGRISAVLHSQSAASCVAPNASFTLAGTEDDKSNVTLTGAVAGGTLTLTGALAPDGKSLTKATYTVKGGSCAFAEPAQAQAQNFTPVSGTYAGSFRDADGQIASITADFSQSTAPDASGNFTLAGTATLPNNPCFPTSVPVSNTQVTGGTFTFTYGANNDSVTAAGTFSQDGAMLTVTNWTASGSCGADQGSGTMARQ